MPASVRILRALRDLVALDQDAPGKDSERALKHAHIGVGYHEADRILLEK